MTPAHDAALSTRPIEPERLMRKVAWRLIPFLFVCYLVNFIDRTNVSFAALTMNDELGISPVQFGWVVGLFFVGYFIFEVPSNLLMQRFGARLWIGRIMITWGIVTVLTAFVQNTTQLYIARVLLGLAEAGFTPGIFLYLSSWFPARWRAKALATFLVGIPVSTVIGGPVASWILSLHLIGSLSAWRWLFIAEGVPATLLGVLCLFVLIDRPEQARWLDDDERKWLSSELAKERAQIEAHGPLSAWQGFTDWRVLTLALTNFCAIVGIFGVGFWMPQIIKGLGIATEIVGLVTAIPFFCGAVGMVLFARSSDRTNARILHVVLAFALATAGMLLSGVLKQPVHALIALSITVVGVYAFNATFWVLPATFLTGRAAAVGIAVIVSVGNLGGFVGPYLVGWLKQSTRSFVIPLYCLAAFLVAGALLVSFFGYRTKTAHHPPALDRS